MNITLIYLLLFLSLPTKVLCQIETRTGLASHYYYKGEKAYGNGRVEEAIAYFDSSFASGNKYAVDYYNVACFASLSNKLDLAYNYLDLSINFGFLDSAWCKKDPDFHNLREDDLKWPTLMNKIHNKLNSLSGEFRRFKNYNNVFPFMKNNLWGFFDIVSGETIIEPQFEYCAMVLDCIHIKTVTNDLFFNKNGELLNDSDFYNNNPYFYSRRHPFKSLEKIQISNTDDFIGFRLNASRDTILFSGIYDGFYPKHFNIGHPFLLNKNYYIPAYNNSKWGIIDTSGKSLNHFEFSYDNLIFNSIHKKTNWFYYEKDDERGFINDKGKKWDNENLLSYPYVSSDIARVNLQTKDVNGINYNGLLDYENLCWLFKPIPIEHISKKTDFDNIKIVGHAVRITQKGIFKNKFKKEGYLIIKNNDKAGYIDSNLKFYYPTK